jgi:hypothetical protein
VTERSNSGRAGLDISIFSDQSELVPVVRTKDEVFSQTALDAFKANDLDLLINAQQYALLPDVPRSLSTMITNGAADPANVLAIGQTVLNGAVIAGRSSPGYCLVVDWSVNGNGTRTTSPN